MKDVIIIGGGLSGMTSAYHLKKKGLDVQVLEASDRLGGRIKTNINSTGGVFELGATWVFYDKRLRELLQELGIGLYKQYNEGYALYERSSLLKPEKFMSSQMTGGQDYHKIEGGTYQIIEALESRIGKEKISINTIIKKIEDKGDHICVTSENKEYKAKNVIITIPPRLLQASLSFVPNIIDVENNIRMSTHTWMGDSVKFSIEYNSPFWRKKGLAGLAISTVGMLREVQDHVNASNTTFNLVGFLNLNENQKEWTVQQRKEYVVKDLVRLFGLEAEEVVKYEDYIWEKDCFITANNLRNKGLYPHQNNGNNELVKPQMDDKLFFAGAETSINNPGYMEGAVESAEKVVGLIMKKKNIVKEIRK